MLEARQEVKDAYEEVGEAHGVRVQAGFCVLQQLLLQLELNFNIRALEALVTLELV